jgi:hypothetical protein
MTNMAASDMVHASPYLEVFLWLRKYGVRIYFLLRRWSSHSFLLLYIIENSTD